MADWRLFVDTGGTFTDCLAVAPDGRRLRCKVLSSGALRGRVTERVSEREFVVEQSWGAPAGLLDGCLLVSVSGEARVESFDPEASTLTIDQDLDLADGSSFEVRSHDAAPILAAKLITEIHGDLPKIGMRLGTTMGTNALLEGKGADLAFFVTEGFRDLLRIGDQTRPDLFALHVHKPAPLHAEVVCIKGRLAADGQDIYNVGMLQLGHRQRLVLESLQLPRIEHGSKRQHLQRHPALQRQLLGLVDDPHAAAADFGNDAEVA